MQQHMGRLDETSSGVASASHLQPPTPHQATRARHARACTNSKSSSVGCGSGARAQDEQFSRVAAGCRGLQHECNTLQRAATCGNVRQQQCSCVCTHSPWGCVIIHRTWMHTVTRTATTLQHQLQHTLQHILQHIAHCNMSAIGSNATQSATLRQITHVREFYARLDIPLLGSPGFQG